MVSDTNIWRSVQRPILCLAPMDGVTDTVFRTVIAEIGKPDISFTEFVNVEGLYSRGREETLMRLRLKEEEKPVVAQIWGLHPELFERAAAEVADLGFAGVDINMGCPDKHVMKKGACSAMIRNRPLAKEVIEAVKRGANGRIPVSVKTRIGVKEIETESWVRFLLEIGIDELTIHGRTSEEMSKVPVHWDEIEKTVRIRDEMKVQTLILGNGDVLSRTEAIEKATTYGLDGIMIGRGIFHNPWLFSKSESIDQKSPEEKLRVMIRHASLFEETWGRRKHYDILKRFYKIYANGFEDASDLRVELMETRTVDAAVQVATNWMNKI